MKKVKAAEIQKDKEKKRVAQKQIVTHEELDCVLEDIDTENNIEVENPDDEDFETCKQAQKQNRQELRNLAMICDRYGVSSRAGAAIANAALADAGVINVNDQTNVIDKN